MPPPTIEESGVTRLPLPLSRPTTQGEGAFLDGRCVCSQYR